MAGPTSTTDISVSKALARAKELAARLEESESGDGLVTKNKEIVTNFYEAMTNADHGKMNSLYAEDATFSDPVFSGLSGGETRAMWTMLMTRAKNWSHRFEVLEVGKSLAHVKWVGMYDFSKTGRRVENHVDSWLVLQDSKIIAHVDLFDFWKWSRMALGPVGYVLGWSDFLRKKVGNQAKKGLRVS